VATPLTDSTDLIQVRGKPKWRVTGSLTWSLGPVQIGGFANVTSSVYDTSFLDPNGNPYVVDGQTTFNLYAQYRFKSGVLEDTRIRVGARNIFDKQPPLAGDGYLGSLYSPYGRYWYTSISKKF